MRLGFCIDCSVKELADFDFESIKGTHSVTLLRDTPPTQTNYTWYIGICEPISDSIEDCPKNSDICGITKINVKKDSSKGSIVSQIVGISSNLEKSYKVTGKENDKDEDRRVLILYKGANWGNNLVDAELEFVCPDKKDKDDIGKLSLVNWNENKVQLSMKTHAVCALSGKHKQPDDKNGNKDEEDGESWGWFTWIFIFLVLFLSIYIIGGAWFQYSRGNSIDFQSALKEVLENFISLVKGLPAFTKEIIEKFTGNSNRGEYSAV